MFDRNRRAATAVAVVVILVAGALAYGVFSRYGTPERSGVAVLNRGTGMPQVMAYPRAEQPATTAPTRAPASPAVASVSKADQFDALVKTGKPEDAFTAYKMVFDCKSTEKAIYCGNLTPGQLTMAYPLLLQAVAAHVPKAAVRLFDMAPDGTLCCQEIWNDPAYASWKANALHELSAAADRGDPSALQHMAVLAANDGDSATALAYWQAWADKKPVPSQVVLDHIVALATKQVPADQIDAAKAQGHEIARRSQN